MTCAVVSDGIILTRLVAIFTTFKALKRARYLRLNYVDGFYHLKQLKRSAENRKEFSSPRLL